MGFQNLHTHTTFCDGTLGVEGMILAAIDKGGASIGFSEHSIVPFDPDYSISLSDTPVYISEVNSLKEKYKDKIDVFLGLEVDYFTEVAPGDYEYIIGTVHHVEKDGNFVTIDGGTEHVISMCNKHFNGDYYAMVERYFETVAGVVQKTGASIVGHFDLVCKRNIEGSLFDESHPRYVKAALDAMDAVLAECKLFEINTGAMYRLGKKVPYPSEFLLRELCKRGGEIILSSDSHDADSLFYKFGDMLELAKACGFKKIKKLTKNGFVDEEI